MNKVHLIAYVHSTGHGRLFLAGELPSMADIKDLEQRLSSEYGVSEPLVISISPLANSIEKTEEE